MGQEISQAEYYIGADPGVGRATRIAVNTPSGEVNLNVNIPTGGLAEGFHRLNVRAGNGQQWGISQSAMFLVISPDVNTGDIIAAEYFINGDPGVGRGVPLTVSVVGNTVNLITSIPSGSLSEGFHNLFVRTKTASGWGLTEQRLFYISAIGTDVNGITAAEYFIDNDPGGGNGNPISITGSGSTVDFSAFIPTNTLSSGFHQLHIRARTNARWGEVESRMFYITDAAVNVGVIAGAEYFVDTDPGAGNGAPITIGQPDNNVSQQLIASMPGGIGLGPHTLMIRTRTSDGTWGLFETDSFFVTDGPLSASGIALTGKKQQEQVLLEWTVTGRAGNSFDVERSKNGIGFEKIGEVKAGSAGSGKGAAENDYNFIDAQPLDGMNFYRIRQKNEEGKYVYSRIVSVLFSTDKNIIELYPNPAREAVHIKYTGKAEKIIVEIYNTAGQKLYHQNINTNLPKIHLPDLAAGNYILRVADGSEVWSGMFVKR